VDLGNKETKLTDDSMIVTETNGKGIITFASKDFCKIAGYTKEELIGEPHSLVRHSFMPKAAFEDLWKTVTSGNIWNGIVINSTKSGGYYWVKATVYPSKDSNGEDKFISVRVKPSEKQIADVLKLYPTLK